MENQSTIPNLTTVKDRQGQPLFVGGSPATGVVLGTEDWATAFDLEQARRLCVALLVALGDSDPEAGASNV